MPINKTRAATASVKSKKRRSKKKVKKTDPNKDEPLNIEEQNIYLKSQLEIYRHQLLLQNEKSTKSQLEMQSLRERLRDLKSDYNDETDKTFQLSANMTRQYKTMRAELIEQIHSLQQEITSYKDQLETQKLRMEEMEARKDQEISMKDAEIAELKCSMDDMAREFGRMLKQTLDKMSEKIVIKAADNHSEYRSDINDLDSDIRVHTLENFNLSLRD